MNCCSIFRRLDSARPRLGRVVDGFSRRWHNTYFPLKYINIEVDTRLV